MRKYKRKNEEIKYLMLIVAKRKKEMKKDECLYEIADKFVKTNK